MFYERQYYRLFILNSLIRNCVEEFLDFKILLYSRNFFMKLYMRPRKYRMTTEILYFVLVKSDFIYFLFSNKIVFNTSIYINRYAIIYWLS